MKNHMENTGTDSTKIYVRIFWDTEEDGERPDAKSLGLPTELDFTVDIPEDTFQVIYESVDIDAVIDHLSDKYGYCIEGITVTVGN